MITNQVRRRLAAGEPTIGAFLGLGSPGVAGLMANAGFDWLVIETEHNALDSAEIEHMLMAMAGTDVTPIVRVPSSNRVYIQRALDMGALGVLVPLVSSADEARAVVDATRFPPEGSRSFGPLRASRYSFDNDDYLERANENMLVALIVETKGALDELEEIAAVPGVDALTLGPYDMSLALGLDPRKLPLPEIDEVTRRMIEAGRRHGVAIGASPIASGGIQELLDAGITFVSCGSDYSLLAAASKASLAEFHGGA